jgi:hypothetical protein
MSARSALLAFSKRSTAFAPMTAHTIGFKAYSTGTSSDVDRDRHRRARVTVPMMMMWIDSTWRDDDIHPSRRSIDRSIDDDDAWALARVMDASDGMCARACAGDGEAPTSDS